MISLQCIYRTCIFLMNKSPQPGTDFPDHTHEVPKKDALLSGHFKVCMYGQTIELELGDIVNIPKHTVHNAGVIGSETVTFYDSTKH